MMPLYCAQGHDQSRFFFVYSVSDLASCGAYSRNAYRIVSQLGQVALDAPI